MLFYDSESTADGCGLGLFRGAKNNGSPAKPCDFDAVNAVVISFWGSTDGGNDSLEGAMRRIRAANCTKSDLHDLRSLLPPITGGTTGQKVARIDRALKRLERELP